MYGAAAAAAAAVWRRAVTVDPQGSGQDGEIGTVSAASESMTPLCKHPASAGMAFVPRPKDTMRSQSGVNAVDTERVREYNRRQETLLLRHLLIWEREETNDHQSTNF